jgi:hypothetical protein
LVEISNINGETIQSIEITNKSEYNLDISSFDAGVYLVRIVSNDKVFLSKVIKM